MRLEGYDFINLQEGEVRYEMTLFKGKCNIEILIIEGIDSLVSIIAIRDIVETTNNSTPHLRGAI